MIIKKLRFFCLALLLFKAQQLVSVCPLCAVAVGAGVGLTRCLGIDDSITGVWLGGLLTAIVLWLLSWARMQAWYTKAKGALIVAGYYVLNIGTFAALSLLRTCPLMAGGWHKLAVGFVLGSFVFYVSVLWYERLKKNHGGHTYFPFQKIIMPLVSLLLASGIMYWFVR